jgi:methylmalonyl-CoA mutase
MGVYQKAIIKFFYMIHLRKEFPTSSLEEWKVQLQKELKSADLSVLMRHDELEELEYASFQHADSLRVAPEIPSSFPFTRGVRMDRNDWFNGQHIIVHDEKRANKQALDILMKGCDFLSLDFSACNHVDFPTLFEGIEFEYIQVQFIVSTIKIYEALRNYFKNDFPPTTRFSIDFLTKDPSLFDFFSRECKGHQYPFAHVNGFEVQQCGATTYQELAFCLSTGHAYLERLMAAGFSVDQAAKSIHFSVGIGGNYFYELAKLRALRKCWAQVVNAYNPVDSHSAACLITAHIGWMNKSLRDPHTNLLRQTTEAMSAISASVDSLIIHPYDAQSEKGTSRLAERMALNISLILREESYFAEVIDPLGGSYAVELLTELIGKNGWHFFQELEKRNGLFTPEAQHFFTQRVKEKARLRIQRVCSGEQPLIGVNKFLTHLPDSNGFLPQNTYLGMEKIVFEQSILTAKG